MLKKRWFRVTLAVLAAMAVLLTVFSLCLYFYSVEQNKTILVSSYTVSHEDIPISFDGKRIVQLTDLHNKDFGDQLTTLVAAQEPDVIVITGDWISRDSTDITVAKVQATALAAIAPVCYVPGNHEAATPLWEELRAHLEAIGVRVLENRAIQWIEGDESVQIIGTFDPEFSTHLWRDFAPRVQEEMYTIFLFHRPEQFETAAGYHADLVLSGHTHGGQIRLPLIGAVYASNQGWFPKYDVGRYDSGSSTMILSQGLGEGAFMRILTPPEIVVVTLDSPYA